MKRTQIENLNKHILAIALGFALAGAEAFGGELVVTNLADSGPGTFRDRIAVSAPSDTISFEVTGTISLNSQLTIPHTLSIFGPGAQALRISGNNITRVLRTTGGSVFLYDMTICDGRVVGTNGLPGANGENVFGGGILVTGGDTHLSRCVISNNAAIGGVGGPEGQFGTAGNGGNGFGGGVANLANMSFSSCHFVSNTASGGSGGTAAPTNTPGVGGQGWGGGLYAQGTGTSLAHSTLSANTAKAGPGPGGPGTGAGGGIYVAAGAGVYSSTIASNSATGSAFDTGGGISSVTFMTIYDSTIVGNQADYGGGINGGYVRNTILAGNSAASGPDGLGAIESGDYNLIQNTNGIAFTGATAHNIIGQNPMLGPLQLNLGVNPSYRTPSMLPLPGSPVIDKGSSGFNDQRNIARPYETSLPNASGGNGADIGAVEINPTNLVVLNLNNSGPGSLRQAISDNNGWGGGNRITFSNGLTGAITLTAELGVSAPVTISGPGPELLALSGNFSTRVLTVLAGPTVVSGLTIRDGRVDGGQASQAQDGFDARGGGIFSQSSLLLSNCVVRSNTVVGGMGGERHLGQVGKGGRGIGGGLFNAGGDFTLINSWFIGNRALGGQGGSALSGEAGGGGNGLGAAIGTGGGTNWIIACNIVDSLAQGGAGGISSGGNHGIGGQGYGAGLYSESDVGIFNSTLRGGNALGGAGGGGNGSGYGGGIYNLSNLGLISSTIASNNASGSSFDFGGGVYNVGAFAGLTNCTIVRNQADYGGGWSGNATAANSIFAGNNAGTDVDFSGTLNSLDYNLIQSFAGLNIVGATANVILGQDPLLGPLQNNGGPTDTMALLPGSPAIDKGYSFGVATDQRGMPRPHDVLSIANASGGNGSDIGAFEFYHSPLLSIQRANPSAVVLSWTMDAANYRLQSRTNLIGGATWSDVNTPRVVVGNQVFVTNTASGPSRNYRLVYP